MTEFRVACRFLWLFQQLWGTVFVAPAQEFHPFHPGTQARRSFLFLSQSWPLSPAVFI